MIRRMTFEDLSLGLRLKQRAGWNQTAADWARFLSLQPDGCFIAELDGVPAGTVTTCIFGPVAWVGMMLVEESKRGRGIGRALMEHALAFLDGQGVRSVRLDATPMGEPLYRGLGFQEQYRLTRFAGTLPSRSRLSTPPPAVKPGRPAHWEAALHLDHSVTRTDRRKLLTSLFRERPDEFHIVRPAGSLAGFMTTRRGSRALHLGPCIARAEAGPMLLDDAANRHAGRPVYIDIPSEHADAVRWAESTGLRPQRQLLRMCRGEKVVEDLACLWASSGPEKG